MCLIIDYFLTGPRGHTVVMGAIFSEDLILNGLEGGVPPKFSFFLQENVVKLTDRNSHHGHLNIYSSDNVSIYYTILLVLLSETQP